MEKTLKEPMLIESMLEDDKSHNEYSEWKLLIALVTKSSVNSGYQNRDFRHSDGTPIIDPETYRTLQNEVTTISSRVVQKHVALYLILVFAIGALPAEGGQEATVLLRVVGVHLLALIVFHFVSQYAIFKKADTDLLALVATHQTYFLDTYGVTMGHSPCTKPIRWWSDDSGITLRRPRRRTLEQQEDSAASDSTFQGNNVPPIYVQGNLPPGAVHIDEPSYDASMKVDAPTWTLLQSTHQELIQTPALFRVVFFLLPFAVVALGVVSMVVIRRPSQKVFVLVGGLVVLIAFAIFMIFQEDKHNQRMYQEVTRRVNTTLLQKDESNLVTLEYHDENSKRGENRRYQFVVRRSGAGVPVEDLTTTVTKES
jgi:hypothetical protein